MRAEVKYRVIYRHKDKYSISGMCRFFEVSRSGYYGFVNRIDKPANDLELSELIRECQAETKQTYGYRRVAIWLERKGVHHDPKTILRVMNKYNLLSVVRRRKYCNYSQTLHRYDNLLNRDFNADRPNQKWVTDITEFKLFGEKLYVSPVLDLYNGEIITYTIGSRPTYSLVSDMLEKALERLPETHQLLMHSGQGWHYQMRQYVRTLESRAIVQSMSRKVNCYDNAVIENFFGIMKSEFLYIKEFENVEHFKIELEKYIDYYNTKRIKAKLKMSPVQYRTHFYQAA